MDAIVVESPHCGSFSFRKSIGCFRNRPRWKPVSDKRQQVARLAVQDQFLHDIGKAHDLDMIHISHRLSRSERICKVYRI